MTTRRSFLQRIGATASVLPFVSGLPSLAAAAGRPRKQRVIFILCPNGTIPAEFWPDEVGTDFSLKRILKPFEPWKDRLLTLKGVANRVGGDGDGHMRGMSCLLTGIELFPGNIQGGSDTPAGWASGPSIDQELRQFLQSRPETRTRFGSLELGVAVPNRADPWTRWTYAGPNQPLAPACDPYELFEKLYGSTRDRENLGSVLDDVTGDLKRLAASVPAEDRDLIERHATFIREMEQELKTVAEQKLDHPVPPLEAGVHNDNDHIPKLFPMQTDLLVNAMANDMARVATFQFTNSVGQARMKWLGIDEPHHNLSHEPDSDADAVEKLTRINVWLCEQIADLVRKLDSTPEPGGDGTMLDHTTIVWTNELGKGNSHTHNDIPFVLIGGGLGFRTGRALAFDQTPHNRLWLSLAHAFGHHIESFGNRDLSSGGPLPLT